MYTRWTKNTYIIYVANSFCEFGVAIYYHFYRF